VKLIVCFTLSGTKRHAAVLRADNFTVCGRRISGFPQEEMAFVPDSGLSCQTCARSPLAEDDPVL